MFRCLEPSKKENVVLKLLRTKLGAKRDQIAPFLPPAENTARADAILVYE